MMNERVKISGCINKVFYAGPAFSAGRLVTPEGRNISFAGNLYAIEGQPVVLAGHWDKHPEYGRQFKVDHVEIEMPSDPGGLAQYLAQHPEIRGIGLARAWKIASELGEEFEEVLLNDPERLARTGGVSLDIVENLRHVWNRTRGLNAAMTWFSAFGLTHHQVTTLMEKLGNNAVAILKSDPYRIIREIKGLGFKKVDQIALKMGTPKENAQRIQAGIHHCVFEALDQGDCWVESEDLIDRANTLLIMDGLDSRERIERELDHLIANESLECHDLGGRVGIALPSIYRQESQLALWFERGREEVFRVGPVEMDKLIARYGSTLNEKQEQAVRNALRYRVSLISGGAGVGKSFCVSVIEAICRNLGLDVTLTAPTGKAAKRIEELSGCEAKTIHRLLGYDGRTFAKGPDDPIESDVLIVDECFDYRQRILAEDGWHHIGAVVNNRLPIEVWSRNPLTSRLELKPVVRWLKKPAPSELLRISASRSNSTRGARVIRCTANHKLLTPYGYRRAGDMRVGEEVLARGYQFTAEQRSVLIGSILGDGSMNCCGKRNSPQVVITQGDDQIEYLRFKKTVFGSTASEIVRAKSGYSDRSVWRLALTIVEDMFEISKEVVTNGNHASGRRRWTPTDKFLEWIDEQALAIWYLDNGSIQNVTLKDGSVSSYVNLHSERFSDHDNARLAACLSRRFGVEPTVAHDGKGHSFLRFNKKYSSMFLDLVEPYIPACMSRKSRGECNYSYFPERQPETCVARIESIGKVKPSSRFVYDIEVADHHNYIAGNLIVSNCSMVDVTLAWRLFRALDLSRTSVILVGDHNQLPPVGPGNVLRDLIRTKALPGTILDVCLRQAGVLKENSTAILKGEVRKTSEKRPDGRCDWYLVDHFTDPSGVTGCLRELFSNIIEEKLGFDLLRDVQVLTPTHKGPLGTQALNEEIQRLVQRKRFGVHVPPHLPNHRPPLLMGDKVIQTRNNYTLGVMNGTVGLVRNIWPDGTYVFEFDGEEIAIKKNDAALRDIQLGFALSVHRAQGSEFPCAIVIMHKSSWFMNRREVLYTAVTRARRSVILLGDRSGLREAATRGSAQQRTTWLSYLLPNAHCLSM